MRLELLNPRINAEGRLEAVLAAPDYGYDVTVSCWPELMDQWGADLVQKCMVREAVALAQTKVAEKRLELQATPGGGEALARLDAFAAELADECPKRIDAYYAALVRHYRNAGDTARAEAAQAEWDAARPAQPDLSALAGAL